MELQLRALDLTDDQGFFCSRILSDLGIDVVKVEKPGGDPSRNRGPFYNGKINPEMSLYWFAYNANKRGITLDIETRDGQEIFKRLVRTADVVIDSYPSGYMDGLRLGYSQLREINPRLVMAAITPFGTTGPYSNYKSCEIVNMAMSGLMYLIGDSDRPPLMISFPHACLHACAQAAVAILGACYDAEETRIGQFIDISIRESVTQMIIQMVPNWMVKGLKLRRAGQERVGWGPGLVRMIFPCEDGFVIFQISGGSLRAGPNRALVDWMESDGLDVRHLKGMDWNDFDMAKTTEDFLRSFQDSLCAFFLRHKKTELFEGGVKRRVDVYPVADCSDIAKQMQLQARDFWIKVAHPHIGANLPYPGAFVKSTEGSPTIRHRAPLIGEHNEELFVKELGFSIHDVAALREAGII
jgi:crotonobetainyl-CoA:carnitine CoA-transferase CaiB-like acyl-CoA transferase